MTLACSQATAAFLDALFPPLFPLLLAILLYHVSSSSVLALALLAAFSVQSAQYALAIGDAFGTLALNAQ